MKNKLIITLSNGEKVFMSEETYAKWLCLIEAMQHINNCKSKNKLNVDKNDKWIKPIEFQKYVSARFPAMLHDVKIEEHLY